MGSDGRQLAGWVPGGHTITSYSQFRIITYSINKVPKNVTNQLLPEISDSGVSGAAPEFLRRLRSSEKLQKSSSDQSPGKISSVMIIIVISQLPGIPKMMKQRVTVP